MKKYIVLLWLLVLPFIPAEAEEPQMLGPCGPYVLTAGEVENNPSEYTLAFAHGNERIYVDRPTCRTYRDNEGVCYEGIVVRIVEEVDRESCEYYMMKYKSREGGWYYWKEEDNRWIPLPFLSSEERERAIDEEGYAMFLLKYHVAACEVWKAFVAEVEGRKVETDGRL